VVLLLLLSSCSELQSDEELRHDIIGTWKQDLCWHPYRSDDAPASFPLPGFIIFLDDGSYIEAGYDSTGAIVPGGGPTTYCVVDSCDNQTFCECSWSIENGKLTITNEGDSVGPYRFTVQYPIVCLRGDKLVFDNTSYYGTRQKKGCFERY
jgi:hypothetical protein